MERATEPEKNLKIFWRASDPSAPLASLAAAAAEAAISLQQKCVYADGA